MQGIHMKYQGSKQCEIRIISVIMSEPGLEIVSIIRK